MRRTAPWVCGLALLGACATMPPPRRAGAPPPVSIGGEGSRQAEYDREHARLSALAQRKIEEQRTRVERVARRLLAAMGRDAPDVQFVVVPGDPSINAGATFGQVAVTAGLLNFVQSDDELAVVLGHELAHVSEGHVMKGAIGSVALGVLAIVADTQLPGIGNTVGGVGQLFLNRFTQGQERDADEVGIGIAYQAGYDPLAAVAVQERLAVEVPQSISAGYFDTHPSSVERAVNARARAEGLLAQGPPPGREAVLAEQRAVKKRQRDEEDAAESDGGYALGRPARRTEAPGPSRDDGYDAYRGDDEPEPVARRAESAGCERARVYREMAADARDEAERAELLSRAKRYCPE